jgi:hypothetical protein
MGGAYARTNEYRDLVDNSERNRPLGRLKCSREENIKMDVE